MTSFGGGPKTGHKMKLYRNGGTVASPSWVECAEIGDLSLEDSNLRTAELKRRNNDFTKVLAGLFSAEAVSFRLIHGLDKTMFELMLDDYRLQRVKEWAVASGDIATNGTYARRIPALLEEFPWDQPLEDVAGHDVRLRLAYMEEAGSEVDPQWVEIGGTAGSA